jgi:hypothetical protein
MNRYENYESSSHRVVLGTAAIAITALAIGLLLVIPATMAPASRDLRSSAISSAASAADEGNGRRLRVDVIAVREPSVAAAQARNVQAKRKQQG